MRCVVEEVHQVIREEKEGVMNVIAREKSIQLTARHANTHGVILKMERVWQVISQHTIAMHANQAASVLAALPVIMVGVNQEEPRYASL